MSGPRLTAIRMPYRDIVQAPEGGYVVPPHIELLLTTVAWACGEHVTIGGGVVHGETLKFRNGGLSTILRCEPADQVVSREFA